MYPNFRLIVQGLLSLTILELLLQVFFPGFILFSSDIAFVFINFTIKLTLTVLASKFGEKTLLAYNTFTGAALFITSISYLTQWVPNIFQLINQRKHDAPCNSREIPAELRSGRLTSRSASS